MPNNQFGNIGAPPSQGGVMGAPTNQGQGYNMYPANNHGMYMQQPQQTMIQNPQPSIQFPPTAQQQQADRPQTIPISGRFVGSADEITPSEVPMDGTVRFFPTRDCSCIYAKAWTPNGTIDTVKYIPVVNTYSNDSQPGSNGDLSAEILSRLAAIEKKLDKKPYYGGKKPYNNKNREIKKEGDNNA